MNVGSLKIIKDIAVFLFALCNLACDVNGLVINVKNRGGDILQETIAANVTSDTITLEYQKTEGTLITQFVDFASEIQVFKVLVLGEEERGESQFQVMCFVLRFMKNEFIATDAMSKLRQKNPGTIRNAEEDKGTEQHDLDLCVDVGQASVISPHLPVLCHDAKETTFARETDLKALAKPGGPKDAKVMLKAAHKCGVGVQERCKDTTDWWQPCTCQYQLCISWYPCGLKYCRGKDSSQKVVSYRCGIKTCKKCRLMSYYSKQKINCLWDE
ncbi:PREDICTED: out at first protein-like [Priapulus caudatus]|uniref:Out at first protein-like n=1 Tax=Priapulus caudatus TaxID=37621 RepID=A0ABM1EHV6_PRICU|nr:PREDICTED: out at first protein-like [Priapulus caudatus]